MHIHARCNFDPDDAAITSARGTETPSLIANLKFRIYSESAGRGKRPQSKHTLFYIGCMLLPFADADASKQSVQCL